MEDMKRIMLCPLVFLVLTSGCGKRMPDRQEAVRLIEQSAELKQPFYIAVSQSRGLVQCAAAASREPMWGVLQSIGWIVATDKLDYNMGFGGNPGVRCDAVLTDSGRSQAASWINDTTTDPTWKIPVSVRKVVAVTGVTEAGENMASAQFTYQWLPVGELGKRLQNDSTVRSADCLLRRYDDGWRLERLNLIGDQVGLRSPGEASMPDKANRRFDSADWIKVSEQGVTSVEEQNGGLTFVASKDPQSSIMLVNKKQLTGSVVEYVAEINHQGAGRTTLGVWSTNKRAWLASIDLDTDDTNYLSFGAGGKGTEWKYQGTPYMNHWVRFGIQIMGQQVNFSVDGKAIEMMGCDADSGPWSVGVAVGSVGWKSAPNNTQYRLVSMSAR